MTFFHVFLVFFLLSALSVLWPLLRGWREHKRQLRQNVRSDLGGAVLEDHAKELEQTRAMGEISDTEFKSLKRDLDKTIAIEQTSGAFESGREIIFGRKSRIALVVVALLMPLAVFMFYQQVGAKQDWHISVESKALFQSQEVDRDATLALIQKVKTRLESKPEHGHLLYLLGSLNTRIRDFEGAASAYRRLNEVFPDDATILAELAQALYLRAGNVITPEVRETTQKALAIEPELPTALGFAGIDAFQSGRYQDAIDAWQLAVKQLDPNSSASQFLTRGIAGAKIALEKAGSGVALEANQPASTEGPEIMVSVSLGANATGLTGDESVFVYARAWQGAKMPLAIRRLTVADLPARVSLTKTQAMAEGMDITSAPQLEVVARVSKTGSAAPQAGDWSANFGPVILGSKASRVTLEIREQVR